MMQALVKRGSQLPSKQVNLSDQGIKTKKISGFITKNTKTFFDIFDISTYFLEEDPNLWPKLPSFVAARKTVAKLRVTNDTAGGVLLSCKKIMGCERNSSKRHNSSCK